MKNNAINLGYQAFTKMGQHARNPYNRMLQRKEHDGWNKGWSQANSLENTLSKAMERNSFRIGYCFSNDYIL